MYVFRIDPEPSDFATLADHISNATQKQMHVGLWQEREKIAQRLRAVAERGTVVDADRSIYNAMRLFVY